MAGLINKQLCRTLHMRDGRCLDKHPIFRFEEWVFNRYVDLEGVKHKREGVDYVAEGRFPALHWFTGLTGVITAMLEISALIREINASVDELFGGQREKERH